MNKILIGHFQDVFQGGVHLLPPFPSTGDRGFAPITYREIEPKFGTWEDIGEISKNFDVMIDIMVNHISRHSKYFQDFLRFGQESRYSDMFITLNKVWPDGEPPLEDIQKLFLRKPEHPFLDVKIEESSETERVWASFGPRVDYSEQIDLDITSPLTKKFFIDLLNFLNEKGIRMVRLDAIGYVIKKPGTSCFMVEPEIYEFIDWLMELASGLDLQLLPEVHAHYTIQQKLASHGYWVYDFVLPMLIFHTLETKNSGKLTNYLKVCPRKQITMLDCHDGIPVQPDIDDILSIEEAKLMVELCLRRGANINRILSKNKEKIDFDAHQINITYYAALDKNDDAYLAARAIQFFSPGVPQVYYVGLLAGENDYLTYDLSGEGRSVNRHNYTEEEVNEALKKEVVQRLLRLIEFRNQHPGFKGDLTVLQGQDTEIRMRWESGSDFCELHVDLETLESTVSYSDEDQTNQIYKV